MIIITSTKPDVEVRNFAYVGVGSLCALLYEGLGETEIERVASETVDGLPINTQQRGRKCLPVTLLQQPSVRLRAICHSTRSKTN